MSAPTLKQRVAGLKEKMDALGKLGLYVYLSTFVISMITFYTLLKTGVSEQIPWIQAHAGSGAAFGGAWVLTKVIQIPRILLTLAITPLLAKLLEKRAPQIDT